MTRLPSPTGIAQVKQWGMARITRSDGSPLRVLVVDDEESLADLLAAALRYEDWEVATAHDGASALRRAKEFEPDVVVLDIMLPDLDGFAVLKRLRRDMGTVPVLFLTAKDSVEDRVAGLLAGGDDYVTKPFALDEVVARITALARRAGAASKDEPELAVGDLVLNEDSHEVWRDGEDVHLSATEFSLLHYLMANAGKVLSKSQILEHVWDFDFDGNTNIVELYISYLRKKIDRGRTPMIHTVRGVGYILKPAEKSDEGEE